MSANTDMPIDTVSAVKTREWLAVQRRGAEVTVRHLPEPPAAEPGHVVVQVVAAGICGADVRVVTGNKTCTGDPTRFTTLGHEAVGIVRATGADVTEVAEGGHVIVLPHHVPGGTGTVDPRRIGAGGTDHMGWDIDGIFADYVQVPIRHVVAVPAAYIAQARLFSPDLGEAVFALTEPVLCALSSHELIRRQEAALDRRLLRPGGRALVLGCGPIGLIHAVLLHALGHQVVVHDTDRSRMDLALQCLGFGEPLNIWGEPEFDVVMAASSSVQAIHLGEQRVRDGGLLYLFAGLNTDEREEMDESSTFSYERLHRIARAVVTTATVNGTDKQIVYLGHSGYFEELTPQAIAMVAAHADVLGRFVTGVIPGWEAPEVRSRRGGIESWQDEGDRPALHSVLSGEGFRTRHLKLIVAPGWTPGSGSDAAGASDASGWEEAA